MRTFDVETLLTAITITVCIIADVAVSCKHTKIRYEPPLV